MPAMRAPVVVAAMTLALALPLLAAPALVASADEGSPSAPIAASPRVRPPLGVLRHVDAPRTAAPSATPAARELVVLVGGYQSCACPDDGTFDALRERLAGDDHMDVVRFGSDPRFPYDTYGAVAPNARNLRDEIRAASPQYAGVHIVTHSMGGVVADSAFAQGLSRDDGVISYVSLSAPHSGSDAARAIEVTQLLTGAAGGGLREGLLWLRMEADSPAVRDLARARPSAPPAGVVRLDLREATDLLVTALDAADPGVPSRILTGPVEGHGGILSDPQAIDQTMRTIAERRVPPDERSLALRLAAEHESQRVGDGVFVAVAVLAAVACMTAMLLRGPAPTILGQALRAYLPRAERRSCP
jgi:hypothetical protein